MSFPNNLAYSERTVQVFYANNSAMQTWVKPPNARFVHFYVIGGGGGGGAGTSGAAGSNRSGGGGGAGSSITMGLFQANMLPDILYLRVGVGGSGGTQGATTSPAYNGATGGISYVSISPSNITTAQNVVLASALASANGGGAGGGAGGGGGTAPTAWTAVNSLFNDLGLVTTLAGDAGVATNLSKTLSRICSGGAGGGHTVTSTPNSGGTLNATGFIANVLGGPNTGGAGSGGRATNFLSMYGSVYQPMFFLSGAGGGAINSGTGGAGGNGSFGAGGGGGGAGTTGGGGGRGGDGLIIITTF